MDSEEAPRWLRIPEFFDSRNHLEMWEINLDNSHYF
jgi:hypothetical protein